MPAEAAAVGLWTAEDLRFRAGLYARWAAEAVSPTPELRLSEWAEDHIELPATEPIPGKIDLELSPYLRGILDLLSNPEVTELTWVKSTQVGATLVLIALIGYCAQYLRVPVLLVQPDQTTAKGFNRARLQPVMKASPKLVGLLPEGRGNTDFEVQLVNGVVLRFAGAGSPAKLGERSVPIVIFDEFEKYPKHAGQEADPIKLGTERTRWWRRWLVVKPTTPSVEQGYAPRELYSADCQLRHFVPCPRCGAFQVLSFDGERESWRDGEIERSVPGPVGRICWPIDTHGHPLYSPEEIRDKELAWYQCGACTGRWEEREKAAILARGEWRTLDGSAPRGHVGLHTWAEISPKLTWSRIAQEFLASQDRPELLQNFHNSWLGRPWRQKGERPSFEVLSSRRREGYLVGQVPADARFLTGGVDHHAAWQYWMVWAWGAGFTGWLVAAGREDTAVDGEAGWDRVYAALTRAWPVMGGDGALGPGLRVGQGAGMTLFDAGWDKPVSGADDEAVNEAEVLERCDLWSQRLGARLFHPAKGGSVRAQFPPLDFRGKTYDRTARGRPLRNRLELHRFNPWFFGKDFYARLARPDGVGGFWLPADVQEAVMRQLMAMELVTKPDGREDLEARGDNHWYDCAILCYVAAWRYRLYLEAPTAAPAPAAAGKPGEGIVTPDGRPWRVGDR